MSSYILKVGIDDIRTLVFDRESHFRRHYKVIHQTMMKIIYNRDQYQHQLNQVKTDNDQLVLGMESIEAINQAPDFSTDK